MRAIKAEKKEEENILPWEEATTRLVLKANSPIGRFNSARARVNLNIYDSSLDINLS